MGNKHDNKLRLLHHESELCAEYEDEYDAEETETTSSCLSRVCLCGCRMCALWLKTPTMAEVPVDDDIKDQQRLRLAISGVSQLFTPELAPVVSPLLKRGLKWIEQALCSLFLPLYCQVKLLFLKPALGVRASGITPQHFYPSFLYLVILLSSPPIHFSTFHLCREVDNKHT